MSDILPDWIAADWGSTHLRVWAMSHSGSVLAEAFSDRGMGKLNKDQFEGVLTNLVGSWVSKPTPVVACGMVGSRQGWAEAPYASVPCEATPAGFATAPINHKLLSIHIIPGLRQDSPADVMRGEETQIAGFLSLNPKWDGVICLPGTHTKWVHISADEVVSFQTAMTGDLFAAISGHTVLKHSIGHGWDADGFAQGLDDAISRPEKLAARLFSLRAEGLLDGLSDDVARARLSGLLIGAELASTKPYWLGQQVAVIGAGTLSKRYVDALEAQGVNAIQADGDRATLAGLTAAYHRLKES